VLPFGLVGLSLLHIALLHISGSTTTLGTCNQIDNSRFYPKFIVKDIFGFFLVVGSLSLFTVFWHPNALGHPDNYIKADALVTPAHIVPEWYFLSFYAILRCIPDKLGGVIAMFLSILIFFSLPSIANFKCYTAKLMKPAQVFFWCYICSVLLLVRLGACVVAEPYVFASRLIATYYFSYLSIFLW